MPLASVTGVRCVPVSTLVTVTVTPARTAPVASRTTPSIVPFMACDWAKRDEARASAASVPRPKREGFILASCLERGKRHGAPPRAEYGPGVKRGSSPASSGLVAPALGYLTKR